MPETEFNPPTLAVAGGEFALDLTYGHIEDLRDDPEIGVDLIENDERLAGVVALTVNHGLLIRVLWELVKEQAAQRELDETTFRRSFRGEQLKAGWVALMEAVDFFIRTAQGEKRADAYQELIEAQLEMLDGQAKEVVATINSRKKDLTEAMRRVADAEVQRRVAALGSGSIPGGPAGSSPAP